MESPEKTIANDLFPESGPIVYVRDEPVPSPLAKVRLGIVDHDTGPFKRFARVLQKELWVAVRVDDDFDAAPYRRPLLAISVQPYLNEAKVLAKLDKTVARFNRDLERVERLATSQKPPLRIRLRRLFPR
jgi:hypothetical protein